MNYYVIQLIGFLGTALFFLSFQCKSNRNLFRIQFLSYFCYTVHLLLLGAITGGLSYVINTIRSFCLGSKYTWAKGKCVCAVLCLLQVGAMIFTWAGILDEIVSEASMIISIIRYGWKNLDYVEE